MNRLLGDRWLAKLVIIGVVLDLIIGVALAVVGFSTQHATRVSDRAFATATANAEAAYQACLSANRTRADSLKLWQAVVALIPADDPASARFDHMVLHLANEAFVPVKCNLQRVIP